MNAEAEKELTPEEQKAAIDAALKKRNAPKDQKSKASSGAAAAAEAAKRKKNAKKGDPGYGRWKICEWVQKWVKLPSCSLKLSIMY